jgi:PPOX class probable F420-dependent enzyme
MPTMTGDEARDRFLRARCTTLATADAAGRPHLVPVTFALAGGGAVDDAIEDVIVFAVDHKPKRTQRLRRLANLRVNPATCLLVDEYDEDWEQLWWARADGTARVLPPGSEHTAVSGRAADSASAASYVRLLVARYPQQYGDRPPQGPVVEIAVDKWTGWRAS